MADNNMGDGTKKGSEFAISYRGIYPVDWTASMILVYNDLTAYANKFGYSFAGQGTIASNWGGMNVKTVKRAIKQLLDCKAITLKKRSNDHNEYVITGKIGQNVLSHEQKEIGQNVLSDRSKCPITEGKIGQNVLSDRSKCPTKVNKRKLKIKENEEERKTPLPSIASHNSGRRNGKDVVPEIAKVVVPEIANGVALRDKLVKDNLAKALLRLCGNNPYTATKKIMDEFLDAAQTLLDAEHISPTSDKGIAGIIEVAKEHYSIDKWWYKTYNRDGYWNKIPLPLSKILNTWRTWPKEQEDFVLPE